MLNKGLLKILTMICFLGAVFVSCNNDDDDNDIVIDYDATYEFEIVFTGKWYQEDFGDKFPEGASFANFVGMTHKRVNSLYSLGSKASIGLGEYAETGNTATLLSEIQEKIDSKASSVKILGVEVANDGEERVTFTANLRHKYLTLVSKINPGPDWFVAIENIDLTKIPSKNSAITTLLLVNDAGKKDGTTFANHGSSQNVAISRLSSGDLSLGGVIPNLGYITIINKGIVEED